MNICCQGYCQIKENLYTMTVHHFPLYEHLLPGLLSNKRKSIFLNYLNIYPCDISWKTLVVSHVVWFQNVTNSLIRSISVGLNIEASQIVPYLEILLDNQLWKQIRLTWYCSIWMFNILLDTNWLVQTKLPIYGLKNDIWDKNIFSNK